MSEKIEIKIEVLRDVLKFYRNVLIAIASGVMIVLYAIFNNKVETISWIFVWVGVIALIYYGIRSKVVENEIDELIERL